VYARHFVIKDLSQMNVCQCILLNSEFNNSGTRVELPITEHVLIMEDFHSLTKLSDFCGIGCANWRTKNVLSESEVKEHCREHRKRMSDSLLQFFAKNSSRPLSSSSPISSSFLVWFEWFKNLMHVPTRASQNFYAHSRGKHAAIKDLKLRILICFNSPTT
jgi:hypothetical protein